MAHGIGGLHHDLMTAALMVAALAVTRRDRWLWGAVLVGLAAAVKLPGAAALVGVVLLSLVPGATLGQRVRRSVEVALVSGATLVAVSLASGLGLGWTRGLTRTAAEVARLAPTALLGHWTREGLRHLGSGGLRLATELQPEKNVEHAGLAVLALLALWVLLRRPVPDEASARHRRRVGGARLGAAEPGSALLVLPRRRSRCWRRLRCAVAATSPCWRSSPRWA